MTSRVPSVALYCRAAQAVDARFALRPENQVDVTRLARRLEGLPLALEIAAARSLVLPPAELLRQLDGDSPMGLLHATPGATAARYDDLRTAIAWTYSLLDPTSRAVLLQVAAFTGPFSLEDAEAVVAPLPFADVVDAVSSLVDCHLVDPFPSPGRSTYRLPWTIRAFALELAECSGIRQGADDRRVAWLAHRARAAALGIDGPDEERCRGWLLSTHPELEDALATAIVLERVDLSLDLATGLAADWHNRTFAPAHRALLDAVLDLADTGPAPRDTHAEVLIWSALLELRQCPDVDTARALDRLRRGEALARQDGDDRNLLRSCSAWILTAPVTGEIGEVVRASEEILDVAERSGSLRWRARAEVWVGMLAQARGDTTRAVALGRAALLHARTEGDDRTMVLAAMLLIPLAESSPGLAAALPPLEDVLRRARRAGLPTIEAVLLLWLADRDCTRGQLRTSIAWCSQAFDAIMDHAPLVAPFGLLVTISIAGAMGSVDVAAFLHGVSDGASSVYVGTCRPVRRCGMTPWWRPSNTNSGQSGSPPRWHEDACATWRGVLPRPGRTSAPWSRPSTRSTTATTDGATGTDASFQLTAREEDVFQLLCDGKTNKEIAVKLSITPKTVMHHTSTLYRKLGVRGRSEAVAWALRRSLERLPDQPTDGTV